MDKNKVNTSDVLEAMANSINDALRPHKKKNINKKDGYFWIFKFVLLIFYIIFIYALFYALKELGVTAIYAFGKSLRSVLSFIWVYVLELIKYIIIISLLHDNLKMFKDSTYYKNLYKKDNRMLVKKEKLFNITSTILKILGVILLIITGGLSLVFMFAFIYLLLLLINGTIFVSPLIIALSIFAVSYFTFRNLLHRFFNTRGFFSKNYFIISFIVILAGVLFFGYETSSFEYQEKLPYGFKLNTKEVSFDISDKQKIILKSDSKLDNVKVVSDSTLENKIKVKFEYYDTADVRYEYNFNENDDLNLTFASDLNFDISDSVDILSFFVSTFNKKTMYNYNLFKYPNIYVYVNSKDLGRIELK